jgi:hypothetical protein
MAAEPTPSQSFVFVPRPHPHIQEHEKQKPVKVADEAGQGFNARLAVLITTVVGTMVAAYIFAAIALISLPSAVTSHNLTIIVAWVSSNFLQLVLLPIIIVGQNIQAKASDKRAEDTYKDADATFHAAHHIQEHLTLQDQHLAAQDARLERIIAALGQAFPAVAADLAKPS